MDVELPRLADTLTEGTLARWLKQPGDTVAEGEPIAELETDKINSELAAPAAGVLSDLLVREGETVDVGTVLARITPARETLPERTPVSGAADHAPAAPPATLDARALRLRHHLRASRERVPAGMCARDPRVGASRTAAGRRRGGRPDPRQPGGRGPAGIHLPYRDAGAPPGPCGAPPGRSRAARAANAHALL